MPVGVGAVSSAVRPRRPPGSRTGAALLDKLSRTGTQPLVLLVAPPGYGKTTALLQWVEQDPRETVWVTVEDADNDPNRILGRIAHALGGATVRATVRHMVDRITARAEPVVVVLDDHRLVVLDDVHHLHPAPVPDLLVELAVSLPAGSQLVTASRSAPPLRLGRLRAEGRSAEFAPADLMFDTEEAGRALALAGVDIGRRRPAAARRADGGLAGGCVPGDHGAPVPGGPARSTRARHRRRRLHRRLLPRRAAGPSATRHRPVPAAYLGARPALCLLVRGRRRHL